MSWVGRRPASLPMGYKNMVDALLLHKPVNNRKNRPQWAMDKKELILHCIGERHLLRYKIAVMYWRHNMSAKDISTDLCMTLDAVEKIIHRLARS